MERSMEDDIIWTSKLQINKDNNTMNEDGNSCVSRGCGSLIADCTSSEDSNRSTFDGGVQITGNPVNGTNARCDSRPRERRGLWSGTNARFGVVDGQGGDDYYVSIGGPDRDDGGYSEMIVGDRTSRVLTDAFLTISQGVTRTEQFIKEIEKKIERIDEAVQGLTTGLEEQGARILKLEKRVLAIENRQCTRRRRSPVAPPTHAEARRGPVPAPGAAMSANWAPLSSLPSLSPSPPPSPPPACPLSVPFAAPADHSPPPGPPLRSISCGMCGSQVRSCCAHRFASLGRNLLKSAHEGNLRDVRKLLDDGADVNYPNSSKWTPLHRAAAKGRSDVISLLLQRGANVNAKTSYGFTPLHTAACNDYTGQCIDQLIDAQPEINSQDRSLRTPLHYAAAYGNRAATRALLVAGAKKGARDDEGWTPYDVASSDNVRRLFLY